MKPKLFAKIRCFAGEMKAKKMIASFALLLLAIYLSQAQGMKANKSVSTTGQMSGAVARYKAAGPLLQAPTAARREILDAYGKLPLSFEANQGQTDTQVKFLSRGRGYAMFLTRRAETVLVLRRPSPKQDSRHPTGLLAASKPKPEPVTPPVVVRMKLDGANATPQVEGLEELSGKANYFIGNDPAKWRTNVPTYARVQYHTAVYPGVDLVYYGNRG